MNGIAFIFFGTAPFALFCSESGNGVVLCIVFLALGTICKWIGNGGLEPKIKVESKDWWEINYRQNMAQGRGHEASKGIADYTTTSNHCPMPSEETKERIASSLGVVTEKMKNDAEDKWKRIQAEKYRLMSGLYEKYKNRIICSSDYELGKRKGRSCCPYMYIEYSMRVLENSINIYNRDKYPWTAVLSENEKNTAKKWIEEYEKRLLKEVNDYVENGVKMPTIEMHKNHNGRAVYNENNIKYGFVRRIGD